MLCALTSWVETWFGPAEWAHARQFAERNLRSTKFLGSFAHINGWMIEALLIGNCRASIRNLGHQHCNCPRTASGVQRRDCAAEVESAGARDSAGGFRIVDRYISDTICEHVSKHRAESLHVCMRMKRKAIDVLLDHSRHAGRRTRRLGADDVSKI